MKIYPYLLIALIVFSISCRKDAPLKIEQPADPILLQEAQNWYRTQQASASSGTPNVNGYTPDWSKAQIVKNSKGENVLGLTLLSSSQEYIDLNVMTVDGQTLGILKQYTLGTDKKSRLSMYDGSGRLITNGADDEKKGLLTSTNYSAFRLMSIPDKPRVPLPRPWDGSLRGEDSGPRGNDSGGGGYIGGSSNDYSGPIGGDPTVYGGSLSEVVVIGQPFHHNRPSYNFPSEPIGSHYSPEPDEDSHHHWSYGGGGAPAAPKPKKPEPKPADIKNEVKDPCLKAVVNSLKNSNVAGKISEIISALDQNTKVQISVVDAPDVFNKNGKSVAAKFDAQPGFVGGNFFGTISISTNTLLPSTKENSATVIIHEVIHSYFAYTGQNKLQVIEHQDMATNYVQPMATFLSGLYNIPIKDATALAWSGLADANSYINSTNFDYPGGSMTKDELKDISRDYITKSLGNPVCN